LEPDNLFSVEEEFTPTVDESIDYIDELVGEGKKFKDVASLARGKKAADQYIEVLKEHLAEAQKELTTRTSLESFLDQMKGQKNEMTPEPVTPSSPGRENEVPLDDSTLESKLEQLLAKRESERTRETNMQYVNRVLTEQFGTEAKQIIKKTASDSGMSVEDLQSLALSSPKAFFRLVGVTDTPAPSAAPVVARNGFNSAATPQNGGTRNKAYYDKLKVSDPKKYFSNEITVQMMRDRQALGDKFY
jgi:hypothetical protein